MVFFCISLNELKQNKGKRQKWLSNITALGKCAPERYNGYKFLCKNYQPPNLCISPHCEILFKSTKAERICWINWGWWCTRIKWSRTQYKYKEAKVSRVMNPFKGFQKPEDRSKLQKWTLRHSDVATQTWRNKLPSLCFVLCTWVNGRLQSCLPGTNYYFSFESNTAISDDEETSFPIVFNAR